MPMNFACSWNSSLKAERAFCTALSWCFSALARDICARAMMDCSWGSAFWAAFSLDNFELGAATALAATDFAGGFGLDAAAGGFVGAAAAFAAAAGLAAPA